MAPVAARTDIPQLTVTTKRARAAGSELAGKSPSEIACSKRLCKEASLDARRADNSCR